MKQRSQVIAAAVLALAACPATAQFNGGIEGTVTDSTHASVACAQILLINESTQATQRAATSDVGFFRLTELPPGTYRLEVHQDGFKTWVQTSLVLSGGEARTVYPRLEVGEPTTKIEVTAVLNAIETGSSNVSRSVEGKTIDEVPMVGRNVFGAIVALAPGVTGSGNLFGRVRQTRRTVFRPNRHIRSTRRASARNRTNTMSTAPASTAIRATALPT